MEIAAKPARAVKALQDLIREAQSANNDLREPLLTTWKAKSGGVLETAFGTESSILERFWKVKYSPAIWTEGMNSAPYRIAGVAKAAGILEAAVYQLQLALDDPPEPTSSATDSYDSGLWKHVETAFGKEEWSTVAMLVAQYVEHHIREWSQLDEDEEKPLVGKDLAVRAFAADGPLRLGRAKGETEGWRSLAMGFMQALSNVDRHRIQSRDDLKRYAIGVLGTGSLILTQIRYQHPDVGL